MNNSIETVIHLNRYQPREYQLPILDAIENKGYKRVIWMCARRGGKDVTAWNLTIRQALKKVGVYFYIFPTYAQAKKVIWDSVTNDSVRFLDYIPPQVVDSMNSQEMKIRFKNGSLIQLVGSDNVDRLVGTNACGIVYSEYALQDPRAYQLLRPILTANRGWALFISTPRGKNSFWELWNIALNNPQDWFAYKLTVEDTQHIDIDEIDKERQSGEMSEDLIQQEYYCFPTGTGVFTPHGVQPIETIQPNSMVVSHAGRSRKVEGIVERYYVGEMIVIRSYGSYESIVCTPDHPIQTYNKSTQEYSWKRAVDVTLDDRLVFPKLTLGKMAIISYELCMLLAWYITEGSSFKNGLQFTVGKQSEIDRICLLLIKLGIDYTLYRKENCCNIVVNSVQLVDFFKVHCGVIAHDKRIPLYLISSYESEFFLEMIHGDGCISLHNGHMRYVYTTVSKTLAYQMQLLAHAIPGGFTAGISMRPASTVVFDGNRVCETRESYVVSIHVKTKRIRESFMLRAKNCVAARIIDIKRTQYAGPVYNLQVQYDESYIVHGRAVHNCSFEMGVEGSYYAKYLDKMRVKGQIGIVPYETAFPVHTAWDIGVRDNTSIIFFQTIGQTVRIIDFYEKAKEGLEHYVGVLQNKGYNYGKHIAPHDIAVKEWGSGITRVEKARQLGVNFTIAPQVFISDGIEAVRSMFAKTWIDERNCAQLINALENYRQEWDPKKKVYKANPLHNFASHAADAMRYLAISLPRTKDGISSEERDRLYREAMYGVQSNMPSVFRDDLPTY